uniref:Uncharacterized protein n=1 Tax=Wuchereria bancrofti TaxID=6293 RepID=A0A1I8EWW4_WUCBA
MLKQKHLDSLIININNRNIMWNNFTLMKNIVKKLEQIVYIIHQKIMNQMHMKHPVGVNMEKDIIMMQKVLMRMKMAENFMMVGQIIFRKVMSMRVRRIILKVYSIYCLFLIIFFIKKNSCTLKKKKIS